MLKRNQIGRAYHWQLVQDIWSIDVLRRLRKVSYGNFRVRTGNMCVRSKGNVALGIIVGDSLAVE